MNAKSEKNIKSVNDGSVDISIDLETSCGIGNWRPEWLQVFATPKCFVINFSIVAILQGAYFTYLIGSITTLERRYAFESKVTGFILIADNLSQMIVSPIVGYLGSRYNRSHLIAIGELIAGLSFILTALPYFIYGPGLHLLSKTNFESNSTQYEICSSDLLDNKCDKEESHSTVYFAIFILLLASCANGLGYTAFYTIGLPYIDDNVQKKNSPLYISATATLRLCGPALGFLLCSICLAWYEDPLFDPHIDRTDPRWVGAWWIGFLVLGIAIIVFTIPMFMFPKRFKGASVDANNTNDTNEAIDVISEELEISEKSKSKLQIKIPKATEIRIALKRLAKNPILIFHAFAGIFRVFGLFGYYTFKPKYMEMQYRQSASGASAITGSTSVVTMALGIMSGGLLIRYFKPKAKSLVVYMFIVELIASFAIFSAMFFGCESPIFPNTAIMDGQLNLQASNMCNFGCQCTTQVYQPVCASDGVSTYFSPCFAGCKQADTTTNPTTFSDCNCIEFGTNMSGSAQSGYCPSDCNNFLIYIILLSIGSMISSTARTGNTLITLRCVEPKDKCFAMGVIGSFFAVFAFIPYPLIFGAITDATCLVWEESCGETGNCWLYDVDKYRHYLHGAAFGCLIIGTLLDIGVIVMSNRIKNLYDDEEELEAIDNDKPNKIQFFHKSNSELNIKQLDIEDN